MNPWRLSPRQLQALQLAAIGNETAAVAEIMGIGDERVRQLLREALRRMGVRGIAPAAVELYRWRRGCDCQARARADPCTCNTPSGPRHCPEHADTNQPRKARP